MTERPSRYIGAVLIKGVSAAALFGSHIALSRLAGSVDDYGRFSYLLSVSGVVGLVALWGLDRSLVRFISLGHRVRPRVLVGALGAGSAASIGVAAVYLAVVRPEFATPIWLGALAILLVGMALSRALAAILRGLDRTVSSEAILQLGRPLLLLFALGGVVAVSTTPLTGVGMTVLFGVSYVAVSALLLIAVARWGRRAFDARPARPEGSRVTRLLGWSTPYLLAGAALPLLSNMDVLVVGQFVSDADLGLYAAGVRVVSVATLGLLAVSLLLSARIAPLVEAGRTAELQALLRQNIGVTLMVSAPLLGGLLLFGEQALALFGPEYVAAGPALMVLLGAQFINVLVGPVNLIASLSLPQRSIVLSALAAIALLVVVSALTVPRLGIVGGAMGHAAGLAGFNLLLLAAVRSRLSVDPSARALIGARRRAG